MGSIYATLGLSRNPFAWIDDADPGPFLNHLGVSIPLAGSLKLRQLIGPKGAGKSTHLRHWQSLTGGSYYYVEPDVSADPPVGPLVYWDEADRISDRQLMVLFRRAVEIDATVVAGTHRDLRRPAERSGLLVETIEFGRLSPETLDGWCRARIASASLNEPQFCIPTEILGQVIDKAQSSLRDAGDLLHIWVAAHARDLSSALS